MEDKKYMLNFGVWKVERTVPPPRLVQGRTGLVVSRVGGSAEAREAGGTHAHRWAVASVRFLEFKRLTPRSASVYCALQFTAR